MRSITAKSLALVVTMLAFTALLAPVASAQPYTPVVPSEPDTTDEATCPTPTITVVGTTITVTFPANALECYLSVTVIVNPTLYSGGVPASGVLRVEVPAIEGDSHSVSVTVTTKAGTTRSASLAIPVESLAAARAKAQATGAAVIASPANAVPANAVPAAQNLAFTGGSTSLPVAAGAALIGLGGLALLAARKREQD